jgi:hypothetical protein
VCALCPSELLDRAKSHCGSCRESGDRARAPVDEGARAENRLRISAPAAGISLAGAVFDRRRWYSTIALGGARSAP